MLLGRIRDAAGVVLSTGDLVVALDNTGFPKVATVTECGLNSSGMGMVKLTRVDPDGSVVGWDALVPGSSRSQSVVRVSGAVSRPPVIGDVVMYSGRRPGTMVFSVVEEIHRLPAHLSGPDDLAVRLVATLVKGKWVVGDGGDREYISATAVRAVVG